MLGYVFVAGWLAGWLADWRSLLELMLKLTSGSDNRDQQGWCSCKRVQSGLRCGFGHGGVHHTATLPFGFPWLVQEVGSD